MFEGKNLQNDLINIKRLKLLNVNRVKINV